MSGKYEIPEHIIARCVKADQEVHRLSTSDYNNRYIESIKAALEKFLEIVNEST